jgi:hypothetical protein
MFVAIGILLPIVFHAIGLGKVFLPMHIPVLLAGFFCGPVVALLVGAVTPLLSSIWTGMPPMMPPIAQMMVFELAAYGLLAGLLYERFRLGVYPSLITAMVGGRLVYGFLGYLVLPLFGFTQVPLFAPLLYAFGQSLPGVIIQLVFIPLVITLVERNPAVLTAARRPAGPAR